MIFEWTEVVEETGLRFLHFRRWWFLGKYSTLKRRTRKSTGEASSHHTHLPHANVHTTHNSLAAGVSEVTMCGRGTLEGSQLLLTAVVAVCWKKKTPLNSLACHSAGFFTAGRRRQPELRAGFFSGSA